MIMPFDPQNVPLTGIHLIEASAGTGKTHAIADLFLRLIAAAGVPVDRILVVTFTRSATAELRDRIRRRLATALQAVRSAAPMDDALAALMTDGQTAGRALPRLSAALADFDRAPILTIHGFCHRILQDHAFDTGMVFDATLAADMVPYQLMVADDFWRREVMPLSALAIRCVQSAVSGPEALLAGNRRLVGPMMTVLAPPEGALPEAALESYLTEHRQLQADWQDHREEILALLEDPAMNGTVFGSVKPSPGRPDRTLRQIRLADRAAAIDAYLSMDIPEVNLPKPLAQLAVEDIIRYTKKNHTPPRHPFFDRCGVYRGMAASLKATMSAFTAHLRYRFAAHLKDALARIKDRDHVLFYDDLLLRVYNALERSPEKSDGLARKIREDYQCALVDEFQDTDALQYRIFSRLFDDPGALLFMIGDPKQAIYAFRGADIFSYLEAARKADDVFTLGKNWRSTPSLVKAVNTVFSQQPRPFAMEGLDYVDVAAQSMGPPGPFGDEPAMIVWRLPPGDGEDDEDARLAVAAGEELAAAAVTAEILRLIQPGGKDCGQAAASPADMAVLVRTNAQGRAIRRHLLGRGIPCVLQSSESVFKTDEAAELWQVLHCLVHPHATALMRAALATGLMGVDPTAVGLPEDGDNDAVARYRDIIHHLGQLWSGAGFMRMFSELLVVFDTRRRLLARVDGLRLMTNLRHLAELIHTAEGDGRSPEETVIWLSQRIATGGDDGEETQQLRLETDAGAVTVVTMHKSKGLEYPVVFCPFLWRGGLWVSDPVYYHDPENDYRETVDFGSSAIEAGRAQAGMESFAENLRLVYVALTRAKHRCYFLWDWRLPADDAALAYLIHGCAPANARLMGNDDTWPAGPFSALTAKAFSMDLKRLETRSDGAISVMTAPAPASGLMYPVAADGAAPREARRFSGKMTEGGRVVSYSWLTAGSRHDGMSEGVDHDGTVSAKVASEDIPKGARLIDFPRGATAGSLFHAVMESIDYRTPGSPETVQTIACLLGDYGFSPQWTPALCKGVSSVLQTPLPMNGTPSPLSRLSPRHRVCEMPFTFPLRRLTPRGLEAVLSDIGVTKDAAASAPGSGRLRFSPVFGHMKGFIDLWFRHAGRFYLLDWKTNYLGPSPTDYGETNLAAAMMEGDYHLQYHLYVLALHLYLKQRVPGYAYDDQFGGVFYLFVRGMDHRKSSGEGIFFRRPETATVSLMEERLLDRQRMMNHEP